MHTFTMTATIRRRIMAWMREHRCSVKDPRLDFQVDSPSGIGARVILTCQCGATFDATDVTTW